MGNQASCAPSAISGGVIRVVHGEDGRVEEYSRSVKAAELMLENPRQFVCDSSDLKVGHRVPGLTADEELERHRLYFILPIDMLYSVLTEEEMIPLSCKASCAMKQRLLSKKIGRILPVFSDFCLFPSEAKQLFADHVQPTKIAECTSDGMLSTERSWRPALDTIEEDS